MRLAGRTAGQSPSSQSEAARRAPGALNRQDPGCWSRWLLGSTGPRNADRDSQGAQARSLSLSLSLSLFLSMYIYIYICTHIYVRNMYYMYMYVCIHIYIYIYIGSLGPLLGTSPIFTDTHPWRSQPKPGKGISFRTLPASGNPRASRRLSRNTAASETRLRSRARTISSCGSLCRLPGRLYWRAAQRRRGGCTDGPFANRTCCHRSILSSHAGQITCYKTSR